MGVWKQKGGRVAGRGFMVAAMVGAAFVPVVAGCTSGQQQQTLSGEKVANWIAAEVTRGTGERPDWVACPEDLPAKEGSVIRCVFTAAGGTQSGVTVTSRGSTGSGVAFDYMIDLEPLQ